LQTTALKALKPGIGTVRIGSF